MLKDSYNRILLSIIFSRAKSKDEHSQQLRNLLPLIESLDESFKISTIYSINPKIIAFVHSKET